MNVEEADEIKKQMLTEHFERMKRISARDRQVTASTATLSNLIIATGANEALVRKGSELLQADAMKEMTVQANEVQYDGEEVESIGAEQATLEGVARGHEGRGVERGEP